MSSPAELATRLHCNPGIETNLAFQPDSPFELAVRTEENENASPRVVNRDALITAGGECPYGMDSAELAGALAHPAELTDQIPLTVHDRNSRGLAIEDVEVAGRVEVDIRDLSEGVPFISQDGSDPVQFLEIGGQNAIFGGQLDLLGDERACGRYERGDARRRTHQDTLDVVLHCYPIHGASMR